MINLLVLFGCIMDKISISSQLKIKISINYGIKNFVKYVYYEPLPKIIS
jgi:hypothetical protein